MTVRPIKCDADYDAALLAIERLMDAAPDTPEADELEVLVTLVEAYEAVHWPIEAPDPISLIEHVMEARGLRQKDLAAVIGSQPHASEVLSRRRPADPADDPCAVHRMGSASRYPGTGIRPRLRRALTPASTARSPAASRFTQPAAVSRSGRRRAAPGRTARGAPACRAFPPSIRRARIATWSSECATGSTCCARRAPQAG